MSIISRMARLFGWSPLELSVQLKIDESSISSLSGKKLFATIVSVNNNGVAILKLHQPIDLNGKVIHLVAAYPRHKGYDIYHVALGAIAVDLVLQLADETNMILDRGSAALSQRFALARMARRHG
jgi:hypothetical protein